MTLPVSATCMGCHTTVATDRPAIVTLTDMARTNQPIPWVRVYQALPGVTAMASCVSCHQAQKASTACITCHKWPAAS